LLRVVGVKHVVHNRHTSHSVNRLHRPDAAKNTTTNRCRPGIVHRLDPLDANSPSNRNDRSTDSETDTTCNILSDYPPRERINDLFRLVTVCALFNTNGKSSLKDDDRTEGLIYDQSTNSRGVAAHRAIFKIYQYRCERPWYQLSLSVYLDKRAISTVHATGQRIRPASSPTQIKITNDSHHQSLDGPRDR